MMTSQFSTKSICQILFKKRLISVEDVKRIKKSESILREKLEKIQEQKRASIIGAASVIEKVTIVDVIVHMELKRLDRPNWVLDEEVVFQALAEEWGFEYKKINPLRLDLNVVTSTLPRNFAMKHLVLPVEVSEGRLTVATSDPYNDEVFDDIIRVTQMKVDIVLSTKADIIKCLSEFFGFKRSIAAAEDQFSLPTIDLGNLEQFVHLKSADELPPTDQHIVSAVNHLFIYAFDQKASDVHIEPKRDYTFVRMRIDGVLHTVYKLPKQVHNALVSRVKTLSRLDTAEKRRPQDGRIKTDRGGVEVEIRISTIPVAFGEKVVMRVLDPDILLQELEGLGFSGHDLTRYRRFTELPHGMALVCGPTGSGKSTTLYSTLRRLSTNEVNVTTIEDPIEMIHEEFNQISVHSQIGVSFDSILKNILRQDPDIIMVGEMRDLETAESAIQASLTGHLVLSTLHTNDAPSAVTRLLDLGVPYYMIQATLSGVLAQRLVRVICQYCKEPYDMEASKLMELGLDVGTEGAVRLHRGKGCVKCRGTGYKGRVGIFEVLPFTESLKSLITPDTDVVALRKAAIKEGMVTLRQNAVNKLLEGTTTYQEVLKITWDQM